MLTELADLVGVLAMQTFVCEFGSHAERVKSRMRGKTGNFVVFGIETAEHASSTQYQ